MIKLRELIHDPMSEGALIASILKDPSVLPRVGEFVTTNEFVTPNAKRIYEILIQMKKANEPIDIVLVHSRFKTEERDGLFEYIRKILELVTGGALAIYYARRVHQKFIERELSCLIQHGYMALENDDMPTNEKIQTLESMLNAARNFGNSDKEQTVSQLIAKMLKDLTNEGALPISTGFNNLDRFIGGLGQGQLILVAGATSMGKTSLMMDFFVHCARIGARPYYYYLEMLATHLAQRMVMNIARVRSPIEPTDPQVRETLFLTENWPAWIEPKPTRDINNMVVSIAAMKETKNIGVVFIDHVQKIKAPGREPIQQMSYISSRLSELACEIKVPIVAACQLNRNTMNRKGNLPKLTDLRGSGTLEHDSDVVLLLHRDDYYREMRDEDAVLDGLAKCYIAKNRHGKKGIAKLIWLPEYCSFADCREEGFGGIPF